MVSIELEGHEQDGERLQRAPALTSIRRSCHDLRPFRRPLPPSAWSGRTVRPAPASWDGLSKRCPSNSAKD